MLEKNKKYLSKFNNLFKTNKALDLFMEERDSEVWVEILKYYSSKNKKVQSRLSWKDVADDVFSEYVRLKSADSKWMSKCVTCWVVAHWSKLQNWHYKSRWWTKYRFDMDNCHPQCFACNIAWGWNYRNYHIYMVNRYWEEMERRIWEDVSSMTIKDWQYQDLIEERYKTVVELKTAIEKNSKKKT